MAGAAMRMRAAAAGMGGTGFAGTLAFAPR